jgi:hypothetical protein
MGGPGFFGLQLGSAWLVISLWDAASWLHGPGRPISDNESREHDGPSPWITQENDELSPRLIGEAISSAAITKRSLSISFSGSLMIELQESPRLRPVWGGSKTPRALSEDDDLRDGVFLSPTAELLIPDFAGVGT